MYYKPEVNSKIEISLYSKTGTLLYQCKSSDDSTWFTDDHYTENQIDYPKWKFFILFIKPQKNLDLGYILINNKLTTITNNVSTDTYYSYSICEPKFTL